MEIVAFILGGLIIGILSGFFGVGGGFILTPILLLFNFNPVIAIGTSLMYTLGTSSSGVFVHLKLGNIVWKVAFIIGFSGIISTQFAHPFVLFLEKMKYDQIVIPVLYLLLLGYFSLSMLYYKKQATSIDSLENNYFNKISVFKCTLIGIIGGFISTTLGVGGGFIIVPLLSSILGFSIKKAIGTSLFSVLFIVSAGFIAYLSTTLINFTIGGSLIAGAIIGSQIGAYMTEFYQNQEIRKLLGLLYIFTWVSILFKLLHYEIIGLLIEIAYLLVLITNLTRKTIQNKRGILLIKNKT